MDIQPADIVKKKPATGDYVVYKVWNNERGRYAQTIGKVDGDTSETCLTIDKQVRSRDNILFVITNHAYVRLRNEKWSATQGRK